MIFREKKLGVNIYIFYEDRMAWFLLLFLQKLPLFYILDYKQFILSKQVEQSMFIFHTWQY